MSTSSMKRAVGLLLPLGAFTGVALAHHDLGFTFSVNPATAGAVAETRSYSNAQTFIPASSTLHLPPGALLAHADDRTSPVSPPPMNGDQVGEIQSYGDLMQDGCGNPFTSSVQVSWVEPIGFGAPKGSVAELQLKSTPLPGLTITRRAFIIKSSGDTFHGGSHYDLHVPDLPDELACAGSSSSSDMLTYGYARAKGVTTSRVVAANPATPGTYNVFIEYTDSGGGVHQDAAAFSVN